MTGQVGARRSEAAILLEHNQSHGKSITNPDFDYLCVAHGSDYSPAYMDGDVCHDSYDESYCSDNCRICPRRCPHSPCPWDDDDES